MVVAGYTATDDGEIAQDDIDTMKRNLNRVMATHPFKGGVVAKQVITELIQLGTIVVVGSAGAGIMVLLPEMKDVITLIQSQGSTIAPLGEAINYNEIKLSRSDWVDLMDKIGRDILNHMHQASMTFLWLLGPPDQVSGPSNARECPIKAQRSELEKFHPLVTQALPSSIWNGEGVFLMEALDELCQQDRIGILKVPNSKLGAGDANASTGNAANQYKIGRYVDITNTTGQGIYGNSNTLMTSTQVQNEFRPYYTTSGGYMYWHDFAVIKLNFLFESLNKIGLTK